MDLTTRKRKAYSLAEKCELGELCHKYKQEYDHLSANLPKKWDSRRKAIVQQKPKAGYYARAIRQAFPELKGKSNESKEFQKAKHTAIRALSAYEKRLADPASQPPAAKKKYRMPGGGRKAAAPEIRQALFEWYVHFHFIIR